MGHADYIRLKYGRRLSRRRRFRRGSSAFHGGLDILPEPIHRQAVYIPEVFRVGVIAGNAAPAPFGVGNDDACLHGVESVFLAKMGEQFDGGFIGAENMRFRAGAVAGLLPSCAARISDGRWLRHLHADVCVVAVPAAVAAPEIPGKALNDPAWLKRRMDGDFFPRLIPGIGEHLRLWLGASDAVKHDAERAACLERRVTAVQLVDVVFVAVVVGAELLCEVHLRGSFWVGISGVLR